MVTNEERREVARKLRETSDAIRDWRDSNPYWYVMKCIYGDVEIHDDNELFCRLADLIEPEQERTCEWHQDENGLYHTSCGEIYETIAGTREENGIMFCPYCGREVVD